MDAGVHNIIQLGRRCGTSRALAGSKSISGRAALPSDLSCALMPVDSDDKRRAIRLRSRRFPESARPGPGRRPIPMLRARILHSAIELFGEHGFDAVAMDDVAVRAGVGKGSLYRQFGSKEQLYAASVIQGFVELRDQIELALADAASVSERVATIVRKTLSYFWTRRQFFALLRDPARLPRGQENHYRKERGQLSLLVSKVLRDGAAGGLIRSDLDFDLMAETLLGMMRGINRYKASHVRLEDAVNVVVQTFLHGCAPRNERK
jgi:AcrR family transcriptional regulator